MGVIIQPLFNRSSLKRWSTKCNKIVLEEFTLALQSVGREAVRKIQNRSASESWIDNTQDLRSSIGYGVYSKGVLIAKSAFSFGKGEEGKAQGKALIEELASEYSRVLGLAVVAGMSYAEYVEACENKDVLASATLWVEGVIEKRLQAASKKAEKRMSALKL